MEKSRPYVILSAAVSIDGKISSKSGDSKLSSKKDLIRLHKLRSKVDAIVIGKNTVIMDDPSLTVRYVKGKSPIRIILDSNGTISSKSKIIQTSKKIPTIIAVSKNIPRNNLHKLKKFPVTLIQTGKNLVSVKSLLKQLVKKNITTLLVEGGGTLNWEFIKDGLFDEIIITITPYVVGGDNSVSFVEGKGFQKITDSPKLQLKSVTRLKTDLVLHYTKL